MKQYKELTDAEKKMFGYPEEPVNENIKSSLNKFIQWETDNVARFVESEKKVYSLKHNVAGICDFLYLNKAQELCLGDIKTSKGIYKTFSLQLAGYRYMIEEENPKMRIKEMTIVRVGKDEGEIEIKKVEDYPSYAKAFLACVVLHNILKPVKTK